MKKFNRRRLAKALKKIQAKLSPHLSETEHQIFNLAIAKLKRKTNWIKTLRKILETIARIVIKMF